LRRTKLRSRTERAKRGSGKLKNRGSVIPETKGSPGNSPPRHEINFF
jgi:hypothetical protein